MQMIIMALGGDLEKCLSKCANEYCQKLKPKNPKIHGWKRRYISGYKEWLCNMCNTAYNSKQFCEFCMQIYLENTAEFSDLDGKEWAQCEGQRRCGRWAHIECLARTYAKTQQEVAARSFKYICCNCKSRNKRKKRTKVKAHNKKQKNKSTNKKEMKPQIKRY